MAPFVPNVMYIRVAIGTFIAAVLTFIQQPVLSLYAPWMYWRLVPGLPSVLQVVDRLYCLTFDLVHRMPMDPPRTWGAWLLERVGGWRAGSETTVWADPGTFERDRLPTHCTLWAFDDEAAVLNFWGLGGSSGKNVAALADVLVLNSPPPAAPDGAAAPAATGEGESRTRVPGPRTRVRDPPGVWGWGVPGDWAFHLAPSPALTPPGFESPSFDASAGALTRFGVITVPSSWQCEGHGTHIYTNVTYPFPLDPPRARRVGKWAAAGPDGPFTFSPPAFAPLTPTDAEGENATGCYRRWFDLPAAWAGRLASGCRAHVMFGGTDSGLSLWVNGRPAGFSKDSKLPAEFDISEFLHPGRNLIACLVPRWCDGSYLEDQDMWWLSGLFRDVTLTLKPASHIADMDVATVVAPTGSTPSPPRGTVTVTCAVRGSQPGQTVRARLYAPGGELAAEATAAVAPPPGRGGPIPPGGKTGQAVLVMHLKDAVLWSAECPVLYTLTVALLAPRLKPQSVSQKTVQSVSQKTETPTETPTEAEAEAVVLDCQGCRVGVRTAAIAGGRFRVNHAPIAVAGVNRHEFDSKSGRALTEESMVADICLMKRSSFNAVRTSHYPNHARFYELCDAYGLYVVDEANIETHGFHVANVPMSYLANRSEWRPAFLARFTRMVSRDRSHACVVAWSLGNEAGCGSAHHAMAAWARSRDDPRPLMYEGGGSRTAVTDVICPMYARVDMLALWLLAPDARPVILCEYSHAMGNSCGGLADYWHRFWRGSRLQGGFIWDWVDQGLESPNHGLLESQNHGLESVNRPRYGYGGDFGDVPHDANFCVNGLVFPDRAPHPALLEAKALAQPVAFALRGGGAARPFPPDAGGAGSPPESADNGAGPLVVELLNRYAFSSLDHVIITWAVHAGESMAVVARGAFPQAAATLGPRCTLRLPWSTLAPAAAQPGALQAALARAGGGPRPPEAFVTFTAVLRATPARPAPALPPWAPEGHVIASAQFPLPLPQAPPAVTPVLRRSPSFTPGSMLRLEASPGNDAAELRGAFGLHLRFSSLGGLAAIDVSGRPVLLSLSPCFFRAPTDNDRGGGAVSYAARWAAAGLDRLRPTRGRPLDIVQVSSGLVKVRCRFRLEPHGGAWGLPTTASRGSLLAQWIAGRARPAGVSLDVLYTVRGTGAIAVDTSYRLDSALPPVARVGLAMRVAADCDQAEWFGRGPGECYPDRKAACPVGRYACPVSAMHVPYLRPGECGARADVRWMAVAAADGRAGIVVGVPLGCAPLAAAGASRFSTAELASCRHDADLSPDSAVHVHADVRHMGLGGDDSWSPSVLPRHLIPAGSGRFGLFLAVMSPELGGDAATIYRGGGERPPVLKAASDD